MSLDHDFFLRCDLTPEDRQIWIAHWLNCSVYDGNSMLLEYYRAGCKDSDLMLKLTKRRQRENILRSQGFPVRRPTARLMEYRDTRLRLLESRP